MGRPFIQLCDDDDEARYGCGGCGVDLASTSDLLWSEPRGSSQKPAYLFRRVTPNVAPTGTPHRERHEGGMDYMVVDLKCCACGCPLGVQYVHCAYSNPPGPPFSRQGFCLLDQAGLKALPARNKLREARAYLSQVSGTGAHGGSNSTSGGTGSGSALNSSALALLPAGRTRGRAAGVNPRRAPAPYTPVLLGPPSSRGRVYTSSSISGSGRAIGAWTPQSQQPHALEDLLALLDTSSAPRPHVVSLSLPSAPRTTTHDLLLSELLAQYGTPGTLTVAGGTGGGGPSLGGLTARDQARLVAHAAASLARCWGLTPDIFTGPGGGYPESG